LAEIDVAVLAGELRKHARRAKNETGYRTPSGMPRAAFATFLRRQARQLSRGIQADDVNNMLRELDEANP